MEKVQKSEEISFTKEIKDEIALRNDFSDAEMKALLSSFVKINGNLILRNNEWIVMVRTENKKIAKMIFSELKRLFHIDARITVTEKRRLRINLDNTIINIEIYTNAKNILNELEVYNSDSGFTTLPTKSIVSEAETRRAYIAGAFLAAGSVNSPATSNYHLEVATSGDDYADYLAKQLRKFNLDAKTIKRRNQHVVYLKKSEQIADFLRVVGAVKGLMKFEDVRIQRDQYNSMNRVYNCDIANDMKSIASGAKQVDVIDYIDKYFGLINLDQSLYTIAKIRLENSEASLNELAELYSEQTGKTISKSGINHRLRKIMEIGENLRRKKDD